MEDEKEKEMDDINIGMSCVLHEDDRREMSLMTLDFYYNMKRVGESWKWKMNEYIYIYIYYFYMFTVFICLVNCIL